MLTPKFKGIVQNGKLTINDLQGFKGYLSNLVGEVSIVVKKWSETRTDQQNRLYWSFLRLIADEYGDDPNDLHEYFKQKYITPEFKVVMGRERSIRKSTTRLSKKEFTEYLKRIELETGIMIPDWTILEL